MQRPGRLEPVAAARGRIPDLFDITTPSPRAASHRDGRVAMLRHVQRHVLDRLHDNELTPLRIAAAHRMSLRHLHLMFQRSGLTVSGWIRNQRLQQCRDALLDPACRRDPIGEIAYRWGFVSAPHFSRAFKNRFGMSPRELRASVARPTAADPR